MKKGLLWTLLLLFLTVLLLLLLSTYRGANIDVIWIQAPELGFENSYDVNSTHKDPKRLFATNLSEDASLNYKLFYQYSETKEFISAFVQKSKTLDQDIYESDSSNVRHEQSDQCNIVREENKFDCYPENSVTEKGCLSRGCCWKVTSARKKPVNSSDPDAPLAPTDVPYCYYPKNFSGYTVTGHQRISAEIQVDLKRNTSTYYGSDVRHLIVHVMYDSDTRLHVKIIDADAARYEVPLPPPPPVNPAQPKSQYLVSLSDKGEPFSLLVMRNDSDYTALLNTTGAAPLMYSDQFLQFSYFLPSSYIYGLGEHRDTLLHSVNWTKFTMWNNDQPPVEGKNLYGSHPFYLVMEPSGNSHGFFLLNSNAMDVILQPAPAITWRVIGGILDFYIFLGPTPGEVIQQYTEVIGHTFMPPYWSLGFHLCRYGYKSIKEELEIVDRVRKAGVPQDVQWNGLDSLNRSMDFTSNTTFGDQAGLVKTIHGRGMHYIVVEDPGISSSQLPGTYLPYDLGMNMSVFIQGEDGTPLTGKVWPGRTVFPDFSNKAAHLYWNMMVGVFHKQIDFDGLWIDMNEISNFVEGSVTGCPINTYEYPPYTPGVSANVLSGRTICVSAKQKLSSHYNLHNMYGMMETQATYEALATVRQKRPFVISRSTFPGQGRWGGHWSGDNAATYHDMYMSIPEILNFNMFGVSMVGADICGFRDESTAELCQRWYQLGAFYPFSRNHNDLNCKHETDPAAFGEAVANSTRKAMLIRYSLIPYLYTLFWNSNWMGETVVRPLFFEFPKDISTWYIDKQFMWGAALLISPVLEKGKTLVDVYFPDAVWYDFYTGQRIPITRKYVMLYTPLDKINLHVRGGYILPMQEPALTTTESRKNNFTLLVALDDNSNANGAIYMDDGDTIDAFLKAVYGDIRFSARGNTVSSNVVYLGYGPPLTLSNVTILGVPKIPSNVQLNYVNHTFTYSADNKVLYVTMNVSFLSNFQLTWT